jgi:hypothetical protein
MILARNHFLVAIILSVQLLELLLSSVFKIFGPLLMFRTPSIQHCRKLRRHQYPLPTNRLRRRKPTQE